MNTTYINGIEFNDETQYDKMDEAMLRSKVKKLDTRIKRGQKVTAGMQKFLLVILAVCVGLLITVCIQNATLKTVNSQYKSLKNQYDSMKTEYAALAVQYASISSQLTELEEEIGSIPQEQAMAELQAVSVQYSTIPGFTYNSNIPLSEDLQRYAYQKCLEVGMNYYVFLGMIRKESSFNPDAVSGTSDYGLCQINQINHKTMYSVFGNNWDWSNPYDSIDAATYLLKGIIPNYNNWHYVLMGYNAGVKGAKEKYFNKGIYSTEYSRLVMQYAREYGYTGDDTFF